MTRPPHAARQTRRSDGESTRRRILSVAGEQFATTGLAGTTNKDIAAIAGVDMASINYHFSNRAGLYQAVLAEAHRRLADRDDLEGIVTGDAPAPDRLKALIRLVLGGAFDDVPWPVILLAREILSPSPHFATLQQEEMLPKLQVVLPLLSEITSIPADDPALVRCLPSIIVPGILVTLVGRGQTLLAHQFNTASREDLVEQIFRFSMGGLTSVGQWHAEKSSVQGTQ